MAKYDEVIMYMDMDSPEVVKGWSRFKVELNFEGMRTNVFVLNPSGIVSEECTIDPRYLSGNGQTVSIKNLPYYGGRKETFTDCLLFASTTDIDQLCMAGWDVHSDFLFKMVAHGDTNNIVDNIVNLNMGLFRGHNDNETVVSFNFDSFFMNDGYNRIYCTQTKERSKKVIRYPRIEFVASDWKIAFDVDINICKLGEFGYNFIVPKITPIKGEVKKLKDDDLELVIRYGNYIKGEYLS